MKNIEIKSLSEKQKDELISKLLKENEELKTKTKSLEQENANWEKDFKKLMIKYNKILKKVEAKTYVIKLANHNKFYSKKENSLEENVINELEEVSKESKKPKGRPKGSKNFSNIDLEQLVNCVITNDIDVKECTECKNALTKIGEDISYKITCQPREYNVTKIITPKYVCSNCNKIYQSINDNPFGHSPCTPSLASSIINAKYVLGVPLHRYSAYLNDINFPLSKQDLCNYLLKSDELLLPLYNELVNSLIHTNSKVIHVDETPLEVIDYFKIDKKYGYVFAYITSYYDNPIYLYSFNKTRSTDETNEWLKNYDGYLVCDGYKGYSKESLPNITIQRCFSHIRRYFYDIVKTTKPALRKQSAASSMVNKIDKLFYLENKANDLEYNPKQIYDYRHSEEYLKVFNDIYNFLEEIKPESGTALDKAVNYFKTVKEESKTFLLDGHIPISNNIAERAIKPFTILRRNFLFSKSEDGAFASGRLFSIIQTARANGLIPEKYIEYVLSNLDKEITDILPWSKKIPEDIKENINN